MKNKGITLIALVVTIVILLILASVSIAMLAGENGIISKAQQAKLDAEIGEEKEAISVAYNGAKIKKEGQEVTAEDINEQFGINGTDATASGNNPIKIKFNKTKREYTIENGVVISGTSEKIPSPGPGLYETGSNYSKLLKDWETLKNEGLITVEDKKLTSIDWDIAGDLAISDEIEELSSYYLVEEEDLVQGTTVYKGLQYLTGVIIPSSIKSIPHRAFLEARNLESVIIPDSVTSIGNRAFQGCIKLKSITIPENITSIESYTFYGCRRLTTIEISDNVTSIGSNAFDGCSKLTNIIIPNSVTTIGSGAFYGCSGLTSIEIPDSVTSIGTNPFSYCSNLTRIEVATNNTKYDSRNNCNAIIEKDTNTLVIGCGNTIISENVKSIGNKAFEGCEGLTSIIIPNSVTSIGHYAFGWCNSLTSIIIPNSVTYIGNGTFYGCSELTTVIIDSEDYLEEYNEENYMDEWGDCYGDFLLEYAETIYIKSTIDEIVIPYDITDNYDKQATSDKDGYVKYIKKDS